MSFVSLTTEGVVNLVSDNGFAKGFVEKINKLQKAAHEEILEKAKKDVGAEGGDAEDMQVSPIQGHTVELSDLFGPCMGQDCMMMVFANGELVQVGLIVWELEDYNASMKNDAFKDVAAELVSKTVGAFEEEGLKVHPTMGDNRCAVLWNGDVQTVMKYRMECVGSAMQALGTPGFIQEMIQKEVGAQQVKSVTYDIEQMRAMRWHPLMLAYIEQCLRDAEGEGTPRDGKGVKLILGLSQVFGQKTHFGETSLSIMIDNRKVTNVMLHSDANTTWFDPEAPATQLMEVASIVATCVGEALQYWGFDTTQYEVMYSPSYYDMKREGFHKVFSLEHALRMFALVNEELEWAFRTGKIDKETYDSAKAAGKHVAEKVGVPQESVLGERRDRETDKSLN